MGKGELTRQAILKHAASLATEIGLDGLTIGRLAEDLGLSKSGLFAHFQSKELLQLAAMEFAAQRFIDTAVKPSLGAPRGEPRVRAFFENWLAWPKKSGLPGGCFFVAIATEVDDQPGPVRERLVELQRDWLDALAQGVRIAIAEGHFKKDVDPDQFAYEMYGIMLVNHHFVRLLRDAKADLRAKKAFESLLAKSRKTSAPNP
ncbi:MAG: TetR/AcrR family transcriptional regulator [Polyangiaceae bacterium]